ncbi:tRNA synthetases class I-domain-containing protein [Cladochytrium replicatum]|nr:tRNA synthetases class I-domain-containing protein [Cladochytrium replicatum]
MSSNTNGSAASTGIPDIPANISFPREEEKILKFWKEIDAFKTSVKLSEGRPVYSFYDGPPFATGKPHYGHILAGTIKDVVTRFAHNTGHYVERRFGWDCHGLPIEYEIDKKLGIKAPEDVAKMGIAAYNEECRSIVMTYASEWEETVTRCGRWIDFKNDYKTMNVTFMESVWWVFKQIFDKGQVYRGFRIMPYSTACATPLSNFEAGSNYKDVIDPAVVVSFPMVDDPKTAFLAWTTTPWTLPSNLALCVHPEFEYWKIHDQESDSNFVLLGSRVESFYKEYKKEPKYKVLEKLKGSSLVGTKYTPIFPFFKENSRAFVVVADTYVTDDSGTGIVHNAPGFGEDDLRVCLAHNIVTGEGDVPCPVDAAGRYTSEVSTYSGVYVKDADKAIQKDLKASGRLIRQSQISHQYPFCWRSDTPLIYKAIPCWFIRVTTITDKLVKNNNQTYWVPDFVKEKRFGNWLEGARDWNISRNRYWGTPIPLWASDDFEEIVAVGSIEELMKLSGCERLEDIHRHHIDHITIPSKTGKGVLRRVPEVFDCWFESGSMPYAQKHYPFEGKEEFEKSFPAQFIAEGLDQTRGWFYTLMVLSTHLFDKPPFQNVIVNGMVLASDGKKMSKRLKNYPDPVDVMNNHGADVLRLYLITSPAVRADTLRFSEPGIKQLTAKAFLPWYNAYRFFFSQLTVLKKDYDIDFVYNPYAPTPENVMDRWILASTQSLVQFVRTEMEGYRLYTVTPRLVAFVDQLTNWYVRFNRRRLKGEYGVEESVTANQTLFEVLFTLTKVMAPFTPFIAELMYQNLKTCLPANWDQGPDDRSVHFLLFPEVKSQYFNEDIERSVSRLQAVIELGRAIREKKNLSLKTPLRELIVIHPSDQFHSDIRSLESYIVEELNVRTITLTKDESQFGISYKLLPDHKALGQKLQKAYDPVRKAFAKLDKATVEEYVKTKKLTLVGYEFQEEDLLVVREFKDSPNYEAQSSKDVLVILDIVQDETLVQEGLAREIINRVQRLRKKAGLQITDDVAYFYQMEVDPKDELANVLVSQKDFLLKQLKVPLRLLSELSESGLSEVAREVQEVESSKFMLLLARDK